jgi:hypothetical protein
VCCTGTRRYVARCSRAQTRHTAVDILPSFMSLRRELLIYPLHLAVEIRCPRSQELVRLTMCRKPVIRHKLWRCRPSSSSMAENPVTGK